MVLEEQRREGLLREMFPDTEEVRHTTYVGDDGEIHEFRSLREGLAAMREDPIELVYPAALPEFDWDQVELRRREYEQERLEPYRDLVEKINREPTFQDTFQDIFDQAFDLLVQRQIKYGPNNIAQQGMWGVLTRIADDKISRIKRAFSGSIVNGQIQLDPIPEGDTDDTFEDACLDLINYGAILLALKRGEWGRPLEGDQ